jgi:hypothetical protein
LFQRLWPGLKTLVAKACLHSWGWRVNMTLMVVFKPFCEVGPSLK